MENAVRRDRAHLGHVDPEDRVHALGERHEQVVEWIRGMAGLVRVSGGDDLPLPKAGTARLGHARHLHVAEERHGIVRAGLARDEDAALAVPAGVQVGVRTFEEGQLGAGRKAGVECLQAHLAVAGRSLLVVEDIGLAGALDPERADAAVVRHGQSLG